MAPGLRRGLRAHQRAEYCRGRVATATPGDAWSENTVPVYSLEGFDGIRFHVSEDTWMILGFGVVVFQV